MAAPAPESLSLSYPDGRTLTVAFSDLPGSLQADLLRQPFAASPSPHPANEAYVLLEWEDGWKEVARVDPGCTGVQRYYVISRTDEVGRLALTHESGYPFLLEVGRRPLGLSRITFGDTFRVSLRGSAREGRKTDHQYDLAREGDAVAELKTALREAEGDPEAVSVVAHWRQQDVVDFLATLAE